MCLGHINLEWWKEDVLWQTTMVANILEAKRVPATMQETNVPYSTLKVVLFSNSAFAMSIFFFLSALIAQHWDFCFPTRISLRCQTVSAETIIVPGKLGSLVKHFRFSPYLPVCQDVASSKIVGSVPRTASFLCQELPLFWKVWNECLPYYSDCISTCLFQSMGP